jgi:D-threo-aldose 1-dehydrogenase
MSRRSSARRRALQQNEPFDHTHGGWRRAKQIVRPEFRYGQGGVPLGNEFGVVTDDDAMETLEASWKGDVHYFDVAPWYGLGLAERRYGAFLHN